jgi:hypothetical protein
MEQPLTIRPPYATLHPDERMEDEPRPEGRRFVFQPGHALPARWAGWMTALSGAASDVGESTAQRAQRPPVPHSSQSAAMMAKQ